MASGCLVIRSALDIKLSLMLLYELSSHVQISETLDTQTKIRFLSPIISWFQWSISFASSDEYLYETYLYPMWILLT